ncbi:protein of unknown function [Burkholderia multivorans]
MRFGRFQALANQVDVRLKSVEEYYDGNGKRTQRFSSELESFKRGAQQ